MEDRQTKSVGSEARLDAVLAECLRRMDAGENIDLEAVCGAHPDVADGIRSYFAAQSAIQGKLQRPDEPPKEIVFATASIDTSRMSLPTRETLAPLGHGVRTTQPAGPRFGRYQLVRLLGEGAMGAVYLAVDTKLGREVALKKPNIAGPERSQYLERFQREAQSAAALSHANICPVYDVGDEDGTPYLTMAYIDGKPLSKLVGRDDLTDRKIVQLIQVIATALQHAHDRGVVHRDLKLSNVLLNKTGQPFVTDFGLAFRLNQETDARLTQEGHILGTPAYMAPEQVEGDLQKIGPSTDIYALGVMLYELLTGQLPFQGSVATIMAQILRDQPKPLSQAAGRKIERELEEFCLTMLAKKPEQRPASMKVVADTLKKWLANNTPDALAKKQRQSQSLSRFELDKQQIQQHITKGNFEHALVELQRLAALQEPEAAAVASWARAELLRVRELKQKIQSGLPALLETARKLIKSHDYTQAVQLLQQVPAEYRSQELKELLGKATDLQDESDLLLADLQDSLRRKAFKGLEQKVDEFLKLKPGNKFAKELREALNTYSNLPFKSRQYDFDVRGQLLPLKKRGLLEHWSAIALVGGGTLAVMLFAVMLLAVFFYVRGRDGVIRVELDDPKLQVTFGDDHITFADSGREIRIAKAGNRKFSVTYDGLEITGLSNTIEVNRNERRVLAVSYEHDKILMILDKQKPQEGMISAPKPVFANDRSYPPLPKFVEVDRSVNWIPLEIASFVSQGGATHRRLDDRSILVTGANPQKDTYTVKAPIPAGLARITAIKLEALTDGKTGPGRNDHGSFVVSHVKFRVEDGQPIPIGGALADFASSGDTSYTLIDRPANLPLPERAKREGGWMNLAWIPGNRVSRAVIMTPELPPTATPGQTLQFVIEQQDSDWFSLERFRISVTGDPVDLALDPTGANRKIAATNPASVLLIGRGFRWDSLNLKEDKLPEEKFALVDVHFHAGSKVDDILNDLASLSRLRSLTVSSRQDAEQLIARAPFLDQIIIWNCPLTDSLGKEIGKRQELRNLHIWGQQSDKPALLLQNAPQNVRFVFLLDTRTLGPETWNALAGMTRLDTLWIARCDLSASDLVRLNALSQLVDLHLTQHPKLDDAALEQFPKLERLRTLKLTGSPATEIGARRLQQRMPELTIITGVEGNETTHKPLKTAAANMKPDQNSGKSAETDPAKDVSPGWTELFNGKDLTGWDKYTGGADGVGDPWSIENGILIGRSTPGPRGVLSSQKEYQDFEFEVGFRLTPRKDYPTGDAGIGLFTTQATATQRPQWIEVYLYDGPKGPAGFKYDTGSIDGKFIPPTANMRSGDWNTLSIRREKGRLFQRLNSVETLNMSLEDLKLAYKSTDFGQRIDGPCRLCLQSWAGQVEYRNIRIRELSPGIITGSTTTSSANPFPKAQPAPELDGGREWLNAKGPVALRDYRRKIVLLFFWAHNEPHSINALADVEFLQQKYAKELVLIGIHAPLKGVADEKMSQPIRDAIVRHKIAFPVLNDGDSVVYKRFELRSFPTFVVIDPEGKNCGSVSGEGNRQTLDEVVSRLISFHRMNGTLLETPKTTPSAAKTDAKKIDSVAATTPVPPLLRFSMTDIDGKNVALSKYQGKVLLIVNVASRCGNTPQYQQLEALHEKYAGRGLALLGIPSNDFGGQEPGSNAQIREFCTKNYSVKFDLFSKVSVKGAGACDLYKFLTSKQTNPKFGGELLWNFEKFLVNRQGEVVARFSPVIKPDAPEVIKAIETELAKP